IVFGLTNNSDAVMERWLTSNRYTLVGSGIVWPDLDARRLEAVTPSIGFIPERVKSDRADVFRLTLEPGQTVTFAVELSSDRFARVFLWKPLAYELKVRERQLFNGALLGLTGLLAIFLTVIFAANHKAIFPTAALVAWCVLAYLCIDFGFFHKLFNLKPEDNAVYRAAAESAMAASLVIFLHTFLRLGYANGIARMLLTVWMLAQLALVAVAVVDPRLASTFARLSFLLIGGVGALLVLFLAFRGQDRALSIVPTWLLFLVWIFAAAVTLSGRLAGDVVVAGLIGGLVLIVLLIGFTVTQFAFRSLEPVYGADPNEQQVRSLAVDGAGAATWEWNARRDEIKVSPIVEAALGLNGGDLSTKVDDFATHIHPSDRERFKLLLWSVKERTHRRIKTDFQIRHADNTYRWFELEASAVETAEGRNLRCVGLLRDVTDSHQAQQRLLSDAVHCPLTGLPHRELFLDRLSVAMRRMPQDRTLRPTVLYIDIDKFNAVNNALGLVVGDTLLLTIARRLANQLGDEDTLARMNGDQFGLLLLNEREPRALAELAEELRRAMRAPIRIAGKEIVLTGSIGIAVYDGQTDHRDLVREAEIAMCRAKRGGADKVEIFRPEMREVVDDRLEVETELKRALDAGHIKVFYQPIIYLPTEELAGFEALVRWEHPKKGLLPPISFVPIAEESDLILALGSYVLNSAAKTSAAWQKELPRVERPLFVSVNVSSRQLLRQDLVQDVRHLFSRGVLEKGTLRLEITESLLMQNPEAAVDLLNSLGDAGADIALDDFGTGYSSLAYLKRFPFDTIKIDRQFMADGDGDHDGAGSAIVRSVVALAHELGKTVVAEGIESPEEVGFLRSIGCEYAQGYYYGEAMPEAEVIQLLRIVRRSERKSEATGLFRLKKKTKAEIADQSVGSRGKSLPKPTTDGLAAKRRSTGGNG
ncbi:MAG: EAL domain-containing protein, partial [Pseudomonadota bacterium]